MQTAVETQLPVRQRTDVQVPVTEPQSKESYSALDIARTMAEQFPDEAKLRIALVSLADDDDAIREKMIEWAVNELVRVSRAFVREVISRPAWQPNREACARAVASVRAAYNAYDFTLPGGKKIGEAGLDDLSAAEQFYTGQAHGYMKRARICSVIAQTLTKKKKARVRDAISEADLSRLLQEMHDAS